MGDSAESPVREPVDEPTSDDPAREPVGAGDAHVAATQQTGGDTDDLRAAPDDAAADGATSGGPGLVARAKELFAWWKRSRPARALARFGAVGGGVLTGGIAYAGLFSVFAALTIGYTIFMAVLGGNPELRQSVLDAIANVLPGIVSTAASEGIISPDDLQLDVGLSIASAVAVVVLLVSAISCMAALRTAVRAMFGNARKAGNLVQGKVSELAGFAGIALAVLVSAVLNIAVSSVASRILGWLGMTGGAAIVLQVLGLAVAFVVDVGMFMLVVWVLAGERPAWKDLLGGAVLAAIGVGVVRALGTSVVAGSATRNPVLASFAVVVTLLIWVNLIARIVLLAAAWTADPPLVEEDAEDEAGVTASDG